MCPMELWGQINKKTSINGLEKQNPRLKFESHSNIIFSHVVTLIFQFLNDTYMIKSKPYLFSVRYFFHLVSGESSDADIYIIIHFLWLRLQVQ